MQKTVIEVFCINSDCRYKENKIMIKIVTVLYALFTQGYDIHVFACEVMFVHYLHALELCLPFMYSQSCEGYFTEE
jgi:hypothetical protein